MTYLLDTNACIGYLNGSAPSIRTNLEKHNPSEVMLCSVVKAELLYGASKSQVREATRVKLEMFFRGFRSTPFDDVAASRIPR